jgi:hypothetical protein
LLASAIPQLKRGRYASRANCEAKPCINNPDELLSTEILLNRLEEYGTVHALMKLVGQYGETERASRTMFVEARRGYGRIKKFVLPIDTSQAIAS